MKYEFQKVERELLKLDKMCRRYTFHSIHNILQLVRCVAVLLLCTIHTHLFSGAVFLVFEIFAAIIWSCRSVNCVLFVHLLDHLLQNLY